MTEPTRWSEADGTATPGEQALLRAGQDLPMPAHEKQAIWNQLLGALPTTPSPVPTDTHAPLSPAANAAAVAGSSALWAVNSVKLLYLLAAVSAIVAGGYHWLKRETLPNMRQSPSIAVPATVLPVVPIASETLPPSEPSATRIEAPGSTSTAARPLTSHASQLREESLAVMAARQALRANDPSKALHLLTQAQQRFRSGALIEEREALTIEALARTGQSARASARAQAFVNRYPRSPHAADVQRFISN